MGVLKRIARHLSPGGLLAFDVVNPRASALATDVASSRRGAVLVEHSGLTITEELLAYYAVSQIRVVQWHVSTDGGEGERTEAMQLRMIFPHELSLLLSAAGLELVVRFGNYAGGQFTADSLNQVYIARRLSEDAPPPSP